MILTGRDEEVFRVGYLAALGWAAHELARAAEVSGLICGWQSAVDGIAERMKVPPTLAETLERNGL